MKKFSQVDEGLFSISDDDLHDIFGKFGESKDKHSSYVARLINSCVELKENTTSVNEKGYIQRYIDALHQYRNAIKDLPANLMMTNVIKQDNKISEGLFDKMKNLAKTALKGQYLINYNVTNYKAIAGPTYTNTQPVNYTKTSQWTSPDYQYVIESNSSEDAKTEFNQLWNQEVGAFSPAPTLNILTVSNLSDGSLNDIRMGSFDNKLKFF